MRRFRFWMGIMLIILVGVMFAQRWIHQDDEERAVSGPSPWLIWIDASECKMYVYKNKKLEKTYYIATGTRNTPSPLGVWKIQVKHKNWGTGFGTRWLGLNVPWGIYGIHGTNKPGSIGNHASHGCIRMQNRQVEELYRLVPVGTPVVIADGCFGNLGRTLRVLSPGDRNASVTEVQKRLILLGYLGGNADGVYGEFTKQALLKFKKDHMLPQNHYVDAQTYKALGIMLFE